MDPVIARKTWRTLEPVHGMIYFVPEAAEHYGRAGLDDPRAGYFASRSAPIGAASAEVVIATFFNFNPASVRSVIPAAWESVTPEALVGARTAAADAALRRLLGGDVLASDQVAEAAELARHAALAACDHLHGRPLFAAHAALDWPTEPHLVLGMPRRSCASFGATGTSRPWSLTASQASRRC